MLDQAIIMHRGGIALWEKRFSPHASSASVSKMLFELVADPRLATSRSFDVDGGRVRWLEAADNILFIITHDASIKVRYAEALLEAMKRDFLRMFRDTLNDDPFANLDKFKAFDAVFATLLANSESTLGRTRAPKMGQRETGQRETDDSSLPASVDVSSNANSDVADEAENLTPQERLKLLRAKAAKAAKKSSKTDAEKKTRVRMREDHRMTDEQLQSLDFSGNSGSASCNASVDHLIDNSKIGFVSGTGEYFVQDVVVETPPAKESRFMSFFKSLASGRELTEADLKPVMAKMKEHLVNKNVALEVASDICNAVGQGLVGKVVGTFQNIQTEVKARLSESITRILTPTTSVDLLHAIHNLRRSPTPRPYTIAFIGVNGVGKSTNLSKVCFWLLQNKLKILIAACDTFRGGAVEQLRTHVRNLGSLKSGAELELFEKGYGKDSAAIARDAISYAAKNGFDVVLIDTAGRMQDNEPLMRALSKLVALNQPDKLIFVGEALVGNESISQLSKFNQALRDFSNQRDPRQIDGMILSKFDTVDDKVGAALSMSYITGKPILFVGTGQTYTDLKSMRVDHIVAMLMKE